ncbi:MAG: DNA-binding transcriptional LysR family regulator [Candidatus Azotimanducaceae bacterium]
MDIELLKTFIEVNKTRHFGRAADNLYLTPAAVSARIKLLEQQLGVAVFARNRGNILLTIEGERLLEHANIMLSAWERALREVRLRPDLETRLHIGATSGLWLLAMQQRLLDVVEAHPGVAIQAEGHSGEELIRRVSERNLDLVLAYDIPAVEGLLTEKLGELKLVLATNGAGMDARAALGTGYIYVDWGSSFATFHGRQYGDELSTALRVNLASIALSLLQAHPGSAYLPVSTVEAADWLRPVAGAAAFKRPIFVCYQEGNPRLKLIREIVDLLKGIEI